MTAEEILGRLAPYLCGEGLSSQQGVQLHSYLELLLKWNMRINLTAVREPQEIVERHFGESLFAAHIAMSASGTEASPKGASTRAPRSALDFGSGAGFPGLPFAIANPQISMTLLEAQSRKATFLKEAVRACGLANVRVLNERDENVPEGFAMVMMRAVEKFERSLPAAAKLCASGGQLMLLIGSAQKEKAAALLPEFAPAREANIPNSAERQVVLWQRR